MKQIDFKFADLTRTLSRIGLIGTISLLPVQAALPPSAFGVWDRGDTFDPKAYPFIKGFSFNPTFSKQTTFAITHLVEGQTGLFTGRS